VLINPNGDYEGVAHVVLYICFNEVDCLDPHYADCLNATALLAAPTRLLFGCLFHPLKAGIL
jgi:hypothetical protein